MKKSTLKSVVSLFMATSLALLLAGCPVPTSVTPTPEPEQPQPEPPQPEPQPVDTGVVAQPQFDPPPGTYTSAQSVAISSATTGAVIRYTLDGSQPTEASTLYEAEIAIGTTSTVRAIAMKTDLMSAFGRADYMITGKVATPVITPSGGSYTTPVEVGITCATEEAVIHYRLDGGTPQASDPVYGGAFTVAQDGTSLVKATAMKPGWTDSDVASLLFDITLPAGCATPPTFSPAGGLYFEDQTVTITSAGADTIYYTTDGSTPTTSSPQITGSSGSVTVSTTNTQIKAYAVKSGLTDSYLTSATYRLKAATPVPSPDPGAGPISNGDLVTLAAPFVVDTIRYNTSGQDPLTVYNTYMGDIIMVEPHLRAVALKANYENSDVLVAEYALQSGYAYTDGYGHVYQLCYNGADVDVTGLFEHAAAVMTFGAIVDLSSQTYYTSGGKVYQFSKAGADVDVTAGLESFTTDSVLFELSDLPTIVAYRTGNKLYAYDDAGVDADITPPFFSATSTLVYAIYLDGAGHAYQYTLPNPTDVTSFFDHLTSESQLIWIDPSSSESIYGYKTGTDRWVVSPSADFLFDSGEYEHFTAQSVIARIFDLVN